jgi:hypothetical protein
MDMRRGSAHVVSARGTTARSLHAKQVVGHGRSMDLTRSAKKALPLPEAVVSPQIRKKAVLNTPAPPPRHHIHEVIAVHERIERARSVPKSEHISRFGGPETRLVEQPIQSAQPESIEALHPATIPSSAFTAHMSLKALTPPTATPVLRPGPKWQQIAGVTGAIAIMAGYVWLQNYPKLTIQAAASRAGVAATNPSYLPSSYSLADTDASPGLLTLGFKSPSQPTELTIAQQKTTWDTRSLLDNYVASADANFTSVSGQGLTIYMFNNNQAAWVNHGIWYTVKGTARLGRDQILKIAYGL